MTLVAIIECYYKFKTPWWHGADICPWKKITTRIPTFKYVSYVWQRRMWF